MPLDQRTVGPDRLLQGDQPGRDLARVPARAFFLKIA